jgi:hypothetical protein
MFITLRDVAFALSGFLIPSFARLSRRSSKPRKSLIQQLSDGDINFDQYRARGGQGYPAPNFPKTGSPRSAVPPPRPDTRNITITEIW